MAANTTRKGRKEIKKVDKGQVHIRAQEALVTGVREKALRSLLSKPLKLRLKPQWNTV